MRMKTWDTTCRKAEPTSGPTPWSIPKNAKESGTLHAFINYASDYDGAYDNSSYVSYTSTNKKVMKDLYGKEAESSKNDAYIPEQIIE